MKKYLFSALSLALLLGSSTLNVAAVEVSNDGDTANTVVTYGTEEGFTVVIPADFTIDSETKKAEATVEAHNVIIDYGKTLNVKVSGDDYDDSWQLLDQSDNTNTLTYTIGTTDGSSDIKNNDVVLTVGAGEAWNSEIAEKLYFEVTDDVTESGTYKDTLTFTVSVD